MQLSIKEMQKFGREMLFEAVRLCNELQIQYFLVYGSALGAVRHNGAIPWDHDVDILIPSEHIDEFCEYAKKNLSSAFKLWTIGDENYPLLYPRIGLNGKSTASLHLDIYVLIGLSCNKMCQRIQELVIHCIAKTHSVKNPLNIYRKKKAVIANITCRMLVSWISDKMILKMLAVIMNMHKLIDSEYTYVVYNLYRKKNILPNDIYGNGCKLNYNGMEIYVPEQYDKYLKNIYGDYEKLPPIEYRKKWEDKLFNIV